MNRLLCFELCSDMVVFCCYMIKCFQIESSQTNSIELIMDQFCYSIVNLFAKVFQVEIVHFQYTIYMCE